MKPKHHAMTLIEVMMALMITAMIAVVTTSVTMAVFSAQDNTDAYSENVQAGRMSLAQLRSLIASSRLVTEGSATSMTLWAFDADDPGVINAEELIRLRFDGDLDAIQQVYVYLPPELGAAEREAMNGPMTLACAADWNAASDQLILSCVCDTLVATGISAVTFRYDTSPPFTRMVSVEATFGEGAQAVEFRTAASLRAPATGWVEVDHGVPYLVKPDGLILVCGDGG